MNRRSFLAGAALAPLALGAKKMVPGLELYSVRKDFAKDMPATLKAVAGLGYKDVEFFGSYADWTSDKAKETRKMLNDLGLVCTSAHTGVKYFAADQLGHVMELNSILGSKFMIMSSAGRVTTIDGWKEIAQKLNTAAAKLKPMKMGTGFHNHQVEWKAIDGTRPMDVLAKDTTKDVVLQLDVGTCIEAGVDPVAWINANPGRIKSMHMKDWKSGLAKPEEGYRAIFGEGSANWKSIVAAARKTGGTVHWLIEQEGSEFSEIVTAEKCIANFKKMFG